MDENESVPPGLCAGIAYNLKKGIKADAEDIEAEYDNFDTIEAIRDALAAKGIEVELLEADAFFIDKIRKSKADIIFNIAEGLSGRGREAHVPAILSFLGIPYTGSDETTLCISLDKAITKRYLSTFGVNTPRHQLIADADFEPDMSLKYPLIIKPDCEGSGKGISDVAIVDDEAQFRSVIDKNLALYGQPMLAEEFIRGREFTVGLLGNGKDVHVFEPMEICYLSDKREEKIYSYKVKKNYKKLVKYECPPLDLGQDVISGMKSTARLIFNALECRDLSRIDFMLSDDGILYFLEINPLPGLAPIDSDFPIMARHCGVDYNTLIAGIMDSALKRYGFKGLAGSAGLADLAGNSGFSANRGIQS